MESTCEITSPSEATADSATAREGAKARDRTTDTKALHFMDRSHRHRTGAGHQIYEDHPRLVTPTEGLGGSQKAEDAPGILEA